MSIQIKPITLPIQTLKVDYMEKYDVTADQYGITFYIPHPKKYVIGWLQIEQDGLSKWQDHLTEKTWFTEEARRRFTKLCTAHYNWN